MKFKVFVPDSDTIIGGWVKVETIEAATEAEALAAAKTKYAPKKILLKVIK